MSVSGQPKGMGDPGIDVLVVDDDRAMRETTAEMLERSRERFCTETAAGADEGLAALGPGCDCVVSDYQMPDRDGLDFLSAVREEYPDQPFVLFTGQGSEAVASAALRAGVTDYVQKQGTEGYELLANRVENAVSEYRAQERAARLEEEHELVARLATDVFYTVEFGSDRLRMSDGIAQFGYDPADVGETNDWWWARVHPEDRPEMERRVAAAREPDPEGFAEFTGERGRAESRYRWRRADGSYAQVVGRGVTVFEDGDPLKQVGTMEDVTDRYEGDPTA
jgi:CheY-like chemotaxis protein